MGSKNFTRESSALHRFLPQRARLLTDHLGKSDDGCKLLTWAAAEIATTIMASCIPVLRVLLRELRDPHLVETNGTGGRKYYQSRKSGHTGETANSPATTVALANMDGNVGSAAQPPTQAVDQGPESDTSSEPRRAYWDFSKGGSRPIRALGTRHKRAGGPAASPYPAAQNRSQRVLVHVSDENTPGESTPREEAPPTKGVVVQIQDFEVTYGERSTAPGEPSGEYEMGQVVGIGEAR
jgi:hypothetical protein